MFFVRLFVFVTMLFVGGLFVAILGGYGCNGGAAGSSEIRYPVVYWACVLVHLVGYCWLIWFAGKWTFKKSK